MFVVAIKRIRVNFQVRFGYHPPMLEYVKKIPKDQCQTKMESILVDGKTFEDWFRICNIAGLSKILWYCWDNNLKIEYQNIKDSDVVRIEDFARNKKSAYESALKFKNEGVDISDVDYSFMKIQPYGYQKEAVHFFEKVNGIALLGDAPGVGKTNAAICYAVKNKLKTLAENPILRAKFGAASRLRANAFRPELVVDSMEQAYQGVFGKNKTPFKIKKTIDNEQRIIIN